MASSPAAVPKPRGKVHGVPSRGSRNCTRAQRRLRTPQPLLEDLETAPATGGAAATPRAAAPSRGCGDCTRHYGEEWGGPAALQGMLAQLQRLAARSTPGNGLRRQQSIKRLRK